MTSACEQGGHLTHSLVPVCAVCGDNVQLMPRRLATSTQHLPAQQQLINHKGAPTTLADPHKTQDQRRNKGVPFLA